jgi:hypothetical protein
MVNTVYYLSVIEMRVESLFLPHQLLDYGLALGKLLTHHLLDVPVLLPQDMQTDSLALQLLGSHTPVLLAALPSPPQLLLLLLCLRQPTPQQLLLLLTCIQLLLPGSQLQLHLLHRECQLSIAHR